MRMNARVLAIRHLDFKDDQQRPVQGYQVFLSAETDQPGWTQNVELLKCWIPDADREAPVAASLLPGDDVYIDFNRRGKPVIVDVV